MNRQGKTKFLPAARISEKVIKEIHAVLLKNPFLIGVLDSVPVIALLLNDERQVVLANRLAVNITEKKDTNAILGTRPGELLGCVHAGENEDGCGTTEFCRVCGAANAIKTCRQGEADVRECRIIKANGEALDLRVWASLIEISGLNYTFFSVTDITDEKRRRSLERIFFHDVMNSISGVLAAAEIIRDASPADKDKMAEIILSAGARVAEDIDAQKDLSAAETGELKPIYSVMTTETFLRDMVDLYTRSEIARDKKIEIKNNGDISFESDRRLLFRIVGNMMKNALEASGEGDTITLGAEKLNGNMRFWVHNPGVIPEDAQLQLFQRSFSTKAHDRGLGTYSMKLLGERYLKGRISFVSNSKEGTVFSAIIPEKPPVVVVQRICHPKCPAN
ncbi:MAG: HAMP domain-containing sensor histidine kinase [Dehalococcoidales bacterium]|nr:HAMP domain-containing sensor histidine kinase [Dehalococcoidales bacterium]